MNTEQLFKELADLGVCASGRRLWRQSSRDEDMIIKVWKRWPEYWVEHSGDAIGIMRRYFSSDEDLSKLEESHIYMDRTVDSEIGSDTSVFFVGDTKGTIRVKDWAVVKIYLFNKSSIRISCGFNSYVNIECYDGSDLTIEANEGKCKVYSYDTSRIMSEATEGVSLSIKNIERGHVFNGEEA